MSYKVSFNANRNPFAKNDFGLMHSARALLLNALILRHIAMNDAFYTIMWW